jgi:hypothetical protein
MSEPAADASPPEAVRRAAAAMIEAHGAAALGLAALSASRSMRTAAPEAAAFWLCVCDLIRARNREISARAPRDIH